jgi:AcrR family transcriptional regulator
MSSPATVNRHTEATRNAIVEAAVDLFVEQRSDGFAVQEVADRAGLAHRTVYRYFPTRQDLMNATVQHLASGVGEDPFAGVSTVEEWMAAVGPHLVRTEANFELIHAVVAATLASHDWRLFGQDTPDRDTHRWQVFRRQFPNLPDDDARRTFATLRHLTSSTSYVLFRLRFGLSPGDATEAIRSGASLVVRQAARRDRATGQGKRRR